MRNSFVFLPGSMLNTDARAAARGREMCEMRIENGERTIRGSDFTIDCDKPAKSGPRGIRVAGWLTIHG